MNLCLSLRSDTMKIAVISTVWFPLSHADVIVTRWMKPFPNDAAKGWSHPASTIASAWIEQRPNNDIGVRFCAENGILLTETIEQALTLGTETLAVDGVLLIGEHGDYPRNEFGQKLYPRKRLFDEIVKVFRTSGRAVPVFNDKHFSWDFAECCEMMRVSDELGFCLYGGSSLTHCPCVPSQPVKTGEEIFEALALFYGGPEDYGFHSMEFLQAFLEKRSGGEKGIRAVRCLEGAAALQALSNGEVARDLLLHALACHGYPAEEAIISFVLERTEGAVLFQFEYMDGLRVSHVMLPKFVSNWVASLRLSDGQIRSCEVDCGRGGPDFFGNFAYLNVQLEKLFRTRQPPTPPLRTHLVSGALQAVLQAAKQDGRWMDTPQLSIAY